MRLPHTPKAFQKPILVLAVLSACGLAVVFAPLSAFAGQATNNDVFIKACEDVPDSETCKTQASVTSTNSPISGTDGFLYKASRLVAAVAAIAAVIIIIVSGFRYVTSGGDSQKAASAKSGLIGALIGLIIIVAAQTIITFVVKRIH